MTEEREPLLKFYNDLDAIEIRLEAGNGDHQAPQGPYKVELVFHDPAIGTAEDGAIYTYAKLSDATAKFNELMLHELDHLKNQFD